MALHLGMAFFENGLGLGYTGNGWFLCSSIDVLEYRQLVAVCSLSMALCRQLCPQRGPSEHIMCCAVFLSCCVDTCGL